GRRDHWVRWLGLLAVALYWWCPLAWWARARLRACEEECCDAWVVDQLPARSYAGAILETVGFLAAAPQAIPAAASGLGRVEALKRRLVAIMERRHPKGVSPAGRLVILLLACLLPILPTRGKPEEKEPPKPTPAAPETPTMAVPPAFAEPIEFGPRVIELSTGPLSMQSGALSPDGKKFAIACC